MASASAWTCSSLTTTSSSSWEELWANHDSDSLPPVPLLWASALFDTLCPTSWRICQQGRGLLFSEASDSLVVTPIGDCTPTLLSFDEYQQQQQLGGSYESTTFSTSTSFTSWLGTVYRYAFATSSTALGDLSTPTALLTCLFVVLLLRSIKKRLLLPYFCNLGRRLATAKQRETKQSNSTKVKVVEPPPDETRIAKFGEYVVRLFYHTLISAYGLYYFCYPNLAGTTLTLFCDFPHHAVAPSMAWYYLIQAAYNVDAMLSLLELSIDVRIHNVPSKTEPSSSLLLWPRWMPRLHVGWSETVRGDFLEMLVHHVITNALVFGSSACRLTRIGSLVFVLHDVSDVPIDLSKCANFLKYKVTTIVCFAHMVLVWMVTRLYLLPFGLYAAVLQHSHHVLDTGDVPLQVYRTYRHFFYIGLALLIALHTAWFGMFCRMGYMLVVKHEVHDYSEHKQGEAQHHDVSQPQVARTTTSARVVVHRPVSVLGDKNDVNVVYEQQPGRVMTDLSIADEKKDD